MKRILVAVSFAVLAVPAFADDRGAPYEVTQFNRGVPDQRLPHGTGTSGAAAAAPTRADSDRGVAGQRLQRGAATSGATAAAPTRADSVWARDWNFIAPPQ